MADIPKWRVHGDWFDTCNCSIPCPCTFAQAPTTGDCEGILAWHIREGNYGGVRLDGLSVMALGTFTGNIWEGRTKASMAMFIDERADERQRDALQLIFGGRVGGWPASFANFIGEVRGLEFAHIDFHVEDDLASWRAEIPGKLKSSAEAIGGPTTPPGKRVQVHNAGGCETGPGGVRPTGNRQQPRLTRSASHGTAPGGRANTSDSTGRDPTSEARCETLRNFGEAVEMAQAEGYFAV